MFSFLLLIIIIINSHFQLFYIFSFFHLKHFYPSVPLLSLLRDPTYPTKSTPVDFSENSHFLDPYFKDLGVSRSVPHRPYFPDCILVQRHHELFFKFLSYPITNLLSSITKLYSSRPRSSPFQNTTVVPHLLINSILTFGNLTKFLYLLYTNKQSTHTCSKMRDRL